MSSEGFDQIQISCVALQQEIPVQCQKNLSSLSSVCQYALTLLWLSLDTCSVHSKYLSNVTGLLNLHNFAKINIQMLSTLLLLLVIFVEERRVTKEDNENDDGKQLSMANLTPTNNVDKRKQEENWPTVKLVKH